MPEEASTTLILRDVKELPDWVLQRTDLKVLDIQAPQLETLPGAISQLQNLEELTFYGYSLRDLPQELAQLPRLRVLHFPNCDFKEFPSVIPRLKALETLIMHNHKFKEFPPEIGQLSHLKVFDADGYPLKTLPKELGQLAELRSLTILKATLETIPACVFELKNLETLILGTCRLTEIPKEIARLKKLKTLNLENNRSITSLPAEMEALTELESLNLASVNADGMCEVISRLAKLKTLVLSCKHSLSKELGRLTLLETLHIHGSDLGELPPELGQLKALKTLRLSSDVGMEMPAFVSELTSLETLRTQLAPPRDTSAEFPEGLVRLPHLRSVHLSNKLLSRLVNQFIKEGVDETTRVVQWNLAMGRIDRAIEVGDRAHLIRALDGPLPSIRTHALMALQRFFQAQAGEGGPIKPGMVLAYLGSYPFKGSELIRKLNKNGVRARFCIRPDTTHVVLGEKLGGHQAAALQWTGPFLGKPQLNEFLKRISEVPEESALKKSLQGNGESVEEALQNLLTATTPPGALTDLFMVYTLTKTHAHRRTALALLQRDGNEALREFLSFRKNLSPDQMDECERLGLDHMTIALRFFEAFHGAVLHLLTYGDKEIRRKVLKKMVRDQELDLAKQGLTSLPEEVNEFPDLRKLDLWENRLAELPEFLGRFAKLEVLQLGVNPKLTKLPESFGQLKSLKLLSLSDTSLREIPAALCSLPQLDYLSIDGLKMSRLPESFSGLKKLRILHVRNNAFSNFPQVLYALPALEELYIDAAVVVGGLSELLRLKTLKKLEFYYEEKFINQTVLTQIQAQLPGCRIVCGGGPGAAG